MHGSLIAVSAELIAVCILDAGLHARPRPNFIVVATLATVRRSISEAAIRFVIATTPILACGVVVFVFFHHATLTQAVQVHALLSQLLLLPLLLLPLISLLLRSPISIYPGVLGAAAQASDAARENLTADTKLALDKYVSNCGLSLPIAAHLLAARV